jgi:hypothetical protein
MWEVGHLEPYKMSIIYLRCISHADIFYCVFCFIASARESMVPLKNDVGSLKICWR